MSESKILPSPWSWEYSPVSSKLVALSAGGQDVLIATKDPDGHAFIDISDDHARAIEALPDLLSALEALFSNEHIDLGDLVYKVRDREMKGWDGPSVTAWSNAVMAARNAFRKAKGVT